MHCVEHSLLPLVKINSSTIHVHLLVRISDPFHFDFDKDSDPRIRYVEKRIRIRPIYIKKKYNLFSSDYPKNIL